VGARRGQMRGRESVNQVIAKVYAAFSPADAACLNPVERAGKSAAGHEAPWLFLDGDLLRISWEGIYFPVDEVLEALAARLPHDAQGKLDSLDLEGWVLTRHIFCDGAFTASTRSLNHVLDYSGH